MKVIRSIMILFALSTAITVSAATTPAMAVEEFTSDTDGWIAENLRSSFLSKMLTQAIAIDKISGIPNDNSQRLDALKAKGYKYLVRGKALSSVTSSRQTKTYSIEAKGLVDKTVYDSKVYYTVSYINCATGLVAYSTTGCSYSLGKDSEGDAIKEASTINLSILPPEYRMSLGKIVSLGESGKKGAKTVFATISHGTPYKGHVYDVYEQIPSEEWGFEAGDMFLSKIGELKLKDTDQDGDEPIEIKVIDGEKEIKDVFEAGVHQMIIK